MSVWYQIDMEVTGSREAMAKFTNLPIESVRTDHTKISFGGKNGPGLSVIGIVENNPDCIFFVQCSIECSTVQYWLTRFDVTSKSHQFIMVQDIGDFNNEINKKILEDYTRAYPSLPAKHWSNQKGYEGFRWNMFFNDFSVMEMMLNKSAEYSIMIPVMEDCDVDFDNQVLDNSVEL